MIRLLKSEVSFYLELRNSARRRRCIALERAGNFHRRVPRSPFRDGRVCISPPRVASSRFPISRRALRCTGTSLAKPIVVAMVTKFFYEAPLAGLPSPCGNRALISKKGKKKEERERRKKMKEKKKRNIRRSSARLLHRATVCARELPRISPAGTLRAPVAQPRARAPETFISARFRNRPK